MANLWETDCVSVSPLPNAQYPSIAGTWDFIFPHTSISSDGDIHIDMATNSSGAGSNGNNTGASPLICEVINSTQTQLSHLDGLTNQQAMFRGIFRFYTEHSSERHFELHPVTQLQKWNGSTFVLDTDYHSNIISDPDGTTHSSSTLTAVLNGSQTMTATVAANNTDVTFNCPSPSVNYCQYDGVAVSGLQSDALSQFFLFKPDLVPGVTVRCRLVANTAAATAAAGLVTNQSLTVNVLTRTDMAQVATQISALTAGQQVTFARPIELIVLGLPSIAPPPTPTPTPSPTPSATPGGGLAFSNTASIAITGAGSGKGNPYPSNIVVSGVVGKITKITARLNGISEVDSSDFASDIDIQMVGPKGQNVMLMSDAGGTDQLQLVTLTFDDAAASTIPSSNVTTGTYKPTNVNSGTDTFPAPAPTAAPGILLSAYNNTNPNGTWSLFVVDDYTTSRGSIANGWTITLTMMPVAPLVTTNAATNVVSTSATLNGTVDPFGQQTTYQFQLGPDTNYGFTQSVLVAGSSASVPVSLNLSGLKPATTYHFRLVGTNATGTAMGIDRSFTTTAFSDSDGDLMPNDYETANTLNPNNSADASVDTDGDGMTNYQEYLAGTNPRSAASVLRVQSVQASGGDIAITFPSVLGKMYTVQETNTLGGPWTTLSEDVAGTGGIVTVTDVEALDSAQLRYYRVFPQ
jgi:hypothetical protein